MDNYLYTISSEKIKANNIDNMDEIKEIKLPYEIHYYPYYYGKDIPVIGQESNIIV